MDNQPDLTIYLTIYNEERTTAEYSTPETEAKDPMQDNVHFATTHPPVEEVHDIDTDLLLQEAGQGFDFEHITTDADRGEGTVYYAVHFRRE